MSLDRISNFEAQFKLPNTPQENEESLCPPTLQQLSRPADIDVSLVTQQSAPESSSTASASQRETTPGAHDGTQECLDFEIGALVQVDDPPLYGVIRVMCTLPKIQGMAAGIELVSQSILLLIILLYCCFLPLTQEEYRKGCSDGTWCKTRYFSCLPGRAFFCPVANLKPDQRFAKPELDSSQLNRK